MCDIQPVMTHSPDPATPLQTAIRRRKWLWVCGCAAGVAALGSAASYGRWRQASAITEVDETEVCVMSPPIPHDPASGLPPETPRPIPADARCPVCGMYPLRDPKWACQVLYDDYAAQFFDSPVDLMQFLADAERYGISPDAAAGIRSRWVTDMASGAWTPLEQAWFVWGSDALGPMRRGDLPAFGNQTSAIEFARRHRGRALAFSAVTPAIIKSLAVERGKGLHEHQMAGR